MSRRPAQIIQSDIARVLRVAIRVGAPVVIVPVGEQRVMVRLTPSTDGNNARRKKNDFKADKAAA